MELAKNVYNNNDMDGCFSYGRSNRLKNKILIVSRGSCTFHRKIKNAKKAGAIGVIIIQNTSDGPFPPSSNDGNLNQIFAVMISRNHGNTLMNRIDELITVGA